MTINSFDLQFFELVSLLKTPLSEETSLNIRKILLKLNNPTYYSKYVNNHPANCFGYYRNNKINPILIAVNNIIDILKNVDSSEKKLVAIQKEYSWAFNNYIWYVNLVKTTH
jgi:hypothetical protein